MTVKELKEILAGAPEELEVMVLGDSGFLFFPACKEESGVMGIPPAEEGTIVMEDGGKIFLIAPHNSTISEDEIDENDEDITP